MRKILFSLAVLFVSLTSCSGDGDNNDTGTNSSSNKRIAGVSQSVSDVLEEKDYDTQKTMYLMLSAEDKHSLWDYKIGILLSENNLTLDQGDLIKNFQDSLTDDIFKEGDDKEVFKNVNIKDFLAAAELVFTSDNDKDLITNTFYTVARKLPAVLTPNTPILTKPCTCHKGSMWSCPVSIDCKKAYCTETDEGCGFFGMYECNGRCFTVI